MHQLCIAVLLASALPAIAQEIDRNPSTQTQPTSTIQGSYRGNFALIHRRGNTWGIDLNIKEVTGSGQVSGEVIIYGGVCAGIVRPLSGAISQNTVTLHSKHDSCPPFTITAAIKPDGLEGELMGTTNEPYRLTTSRR